MKPTQSRRTAHLILCAGCLLSTWGSAGGQEINRTAVAELQLDTIRLEVPRPEESGSAPTAILVGAGLLGSTVGFLAGAHFGFSSVDCQSGEFPCGIEQAIFGAAVGESVLMPLAIHLANRGRGDLGRSLLTSLTVCALGIGAGLAAVESEDSGALLVLIPAVPLIQLGACVSTEKKTTLEKQAHAARGGIGITPIAGGAALCCSYSF